MSGFSIPPRAPQIDSFTTPGAAVWTKPPGAKSHAVILIGAGGAGGGGGKRAAGNVAGGGGGGVHGNMRYFEFDSPSLPSTVNVVVAAGSTGGAGATTNSSAGSNGSALVNASYSGFLGTDTADINTFFCTAAPGNPGSGGNTSGGSGGSGSATNSFPNQQVPNPNGVSGAGASASASPAAYGYTAGCGGGGGGGGLTVGNAISGAGRDRAKVGTAPFFVTTGSDLNSVVDAQAGPHGSALDQVLIYSRFNIYVGRSGQGGVSSLLTNGGNGGNGQVPGGAGGGGGAARDDVGNGGTGGNGASGGVYVVTFFS